MQHQLFSIKGALIIMAATLFAVYAQAQSVGINDDSSSPNSKAILHLQSTSKGFLMPRLTTAQRTALSLNTTDNGIMVFDTDLGGFYFWTGTGWQALDSSYTFIEDSDGDTKIQVEESADEDIIRFDLGTKEYFKMQAGRLHILNTGGSVFLGENAGGKDDLNYRWNSLIGYEAGSAITTGSSNVALGALTMVNLTTASHNIAIGRASLGSSGTTISNNIGIGSYTLQSVTGDENIALGHVAGGGLVSGSNNTFIGTQSGRLNKSGTNNIFLGYYAGYNETGSNLLYIESSNSSTPLIWGDFANDSLRLNGGVGVVGYLSVNDAYAFPTTDGTSGQVLTTNGSGNASWADAQGDNLGNHIATQNIQTSGYYLSSDGDDEGLYVNTDGNVGIGTSSPNATFNLNTNDNDAGGFLVQGDLDTSNGTVPNLGAGSRMMFYPAIAAFRAGYVTDTRWNSASVGSYSVGLGYNSTASGSYSIAAGQGNTASGGRSTAFGQGNTASGGRSTAFGQGNTASGGWSTAFGYQTAASAQSASSFGTRTTASGKQSAAFGWETIASGNETAAFGYYTEAHDYGEIVLGEYNIVGTGNQENVGPRSGENYFTIGNGTSSTRKNALSVEKTGNVYAAGTLTLNDDGTGSSTDSYTFPSDRGTSGQLLATDGTGTLSWTTISSSTLEDADADTKIQVEENTDEDYIRFDVAGNESMIIDNSGNVGIGVTNPSGTFHVNMGYETSETLLIDQPSYTSAIGGATIAYWQSFTAPSDMELSTISVEYYNAGSTVDRTIYIYEGEGTSGKLLGSATGTSAAGTAYHSVTFTGITLQSGATYSMLIDPISYVSFHNSDPYSGGRFEPYGGGADITFKLYGKIAESGFIVNDGGVTINEYTLPSTDGTASGQVLTTNGSGTVSWADAQGDNLGNHIATQNIQTSGYYLSNDGDDEGLYVNTDGNVGIGTSIPQSNFHVSMGEESGSTTMVEQAGDSQYYSTGTASMWQSFTATQSAVLSQVSVGFVEATVGDSRTISIYEGEGSSGTLLSSDNTATIALKRGYTDFSISGDIELEAGKVYSLKIDKREFLGLEVGNPYSDGRIQANSDRDMAFKITVFNSLTGFKVDNNGVTINEYTLPITDGTSNQVLATDGSGTVSWADAQGDNLGNHIATQNIQTSGYYLSNDGDDEGLYVNTDGNVGIGTSSPQAKMDIDGILVVGGRANTIFNATANSTDLNGAEGIILPGTTSQYTINVQDGNGRIQHKWNATYGNSEQFLVGGEDASMIDWNGNTSGGNWLEFKFDDGSAAVAGDAISWNTHMVIDENGNVGIGESDPSVALDVNGSIEYTGTITDVSDRRLKGDLQELGTVMDRLKRIKSYTYYMLDDPLKQREYGVIAQDVQKVFPEMVKTIDKENGYLGVSYIQLIPVLIEAVKEQQQEITQQEEKIENLTKENLIIKERLMSLEQQNAIQQAEFAELKALQAKLKEMLVLLEANNQ